MPNIGINVKYFNLVSKDIHRDTFLLIMIKKLKDTVPGERLAAGK